MPIMMAELYSALKEAGASEDRAVKAAEEAASYENRLAKIESDLAVLKGMVGINLALSLAIIVKLFTVG
jgi:hypothetical protein